MFTFGDPGIRTFVTGLLWSAGAVFTFGTLVAVARLHAPPGRDRLLGRLALLVDAGPALTGLACLGMLLEALGAGLRPGHEAEFLTHLARPLPSVAMLAGGAGLLGGLLATARPGRIALVLGGPTTLLIVLVAAAVLGVLGVAWSEEPEVSALIWAERAPFVRLFAQLALFPAGTLGLGWVSARLGRGLQGWLGPGGPAAAADTRDLLRLALPTPAAPIPRPPIRRAAAPVPGRPGATVGRTTTRASTRDTLVRILCGGFGALLLATASCDLLQPRARLTRSDPEAGTTLATPPAVVALSFSNALDRSSELRVRRTVTIGPFGERVPTGGTPVTAASGADAITTDGRHLRVRLPEDAAGGLYLVDWTATSSAWRRARRFGRLYFGVGMPVPDAIVREGVLREDDPGERDRRATMLGGVICLAIGLAWPRLRGRTACPSSLPGLRKAP